MPALGCDVAAHRGRRRLHLGGREGLLRAQRVEPEQDDHDREEEQERPAPGAPLLPAPVDLEGGQLAFQVRHVRLLWVRPRRVLSDLRLPGPPGAVNFGERPSGDRRSAADGRAQA